MKKEDLLQPEIEKILFEMDFIDKYRNIWEKYDKEDENYKISSKDIMTTFQDLNYSVKKKSKEQYFSDFFPKDNSSYRIGISIKYNIIHFDISIRNEDYNIKSGGGYGLLVQLMTNWGIPISSPGFYDLNSFKNLIGELVSLFEEIQKNISISFNKVNTKMN